MNVSCSECGGGGNTEAEQAIPLLAMQITEKNTGREIPLTVIPYIFLPPAETESCFVRI